MLACIDQPGPHHPAHVGGPAQHIALPHVLVEESIDTGAHGRDVGPGDGLGLPCRQAGRRASTPLLGIIGFEICVHTLVAV